ncbi:MAG TPA: cytochrome C [Rhodocyclaceae bacterium]|nr:cytochrome C [Rhodocyclaceae bacterium]
MRIRNLPAWLRVGVLPALALALGLSAATAAEGQGKLDDATCITCHDGKKGKIEVAGKGGEKHALAPVDKAGIDQGVHAKVQCVACHADIVDSQANHRKAAGVAKPDCATCHEKLWAQAKQRPQPDKRLETVVRNVEAYKKSFHARPDRDNPDRAKAVCSDCHATHDFKVPKEGTPERDKWRLTIPKTCGEKCHDEQLEDYQESAHGALTMGKDDPKGAVCTDCHTTHEITSASADVFKLKNVQACGGCHKEELNSYRDTYHGQVNRLGYTYTAKCADCHGSHGIKKSDDPESKVNAKNRLKTCQQCHNEKKPGMVLATAGFTTFGPHANGHDFQKYPQMWVASKFMEALLIGVFAFFWLHCGLWYYREWKDRQAGKAVPHVKTEGLDLGGKHIRRFAWGWRIAHLVFALVTMTLVLTGTSALYADSAWAPKVAAAVGGPRILGIIHRTAAFLFVGIFMIHFVYVMQKLLRSRTFRWFGPDSLIPNWKDLTDCWAMFKWFLGKGPRPNFERWAYFEKFDYWAVFWGVNIIGWSGLMLAFPHVTATYLPGWVFNVGTLVHGEEAFLAAVFLFTVHFFNNHFRPDKLPPPDVVMFTGSLPLEEFKRDHPAHYERLVKSGELEKHLVDAPSRPMRAGSVALGLFLIALGFTLLALVATGFFGKL